MKVWASAAVLMLAGSTGSLQAQAPMQPGQLRTTGWLMVLPRITDAKASDTVRKPIATEESSHGLMNRLWITSLFAVAGGTSFDAASSWGKRESNPLLSSANGTFGGKGLGIKVGLAAAVIVPQICLRKHKELRGAFTMGNFAGAGGFTAVALHNLGVPSAAPVQ